MPMAQKLDWRVSVKGGTEYALTQAKGSEEAYQATKGRLKVLSREAVEVECLSPVYCPECGAEARRLPPGDEDYGIIVLLYQCIDDGCTYREVIWT